jgi:hypothetical protein
MASIISAGTSAGTAIAISGDTSGNLAFQTQAGANTITVPNATGTVLTTATTGQCKAWVNFSGGGSTINSSYNVSSVTYIGTGTTTVNFTTAMPNTNYAPQVSNSFASGIREDVFGLVYNDSPYSPTTTSVTVKFYRADTNAAVNPTFGYVAIFSS